MSLTTEHRGYKITYSENGDEWSSYDAGDGMSAPTLSKLKAKIDAMIAKQKKRAGFACIVIEQEGFGGSSKTIITDALITGYLGPKTERKGSSRFDESVVIGHNVEAVYVATKWGKKDERAARRSAELSSFCPDTPETHAAIAEANRLHELSKLAEAAHRAAVKAIPRLTIEDIAQLVALSDAKDATP